MTKLKITIKNVEKEFFIPNKAVELFSLAVINKWKILDEYNSWEDILNNVSRMVPKSNIIKVIPIIKKNILDQLNYINADLLFKHKIKNVNQLFKNIYQKNDINSDNYNEIIEIYLSLFLKLNTNSERVNNATTQQKNRVLRTILAAECATIHNIVSFQNSNDIIVNIQDNIREQFKLNEPYKKIKI